MCEVATRTEQHFITEMLLNDDSRRKYASLVSPECMYVPTHTKLHKKLLELEKKNKDVNPFTLSDGFADEKDVLEYLLEISSSTSGFDAYSLAYKIWDLYNGRKIEQHAIEKQKRIDEGDKATDLVGWDMDFYKEIINPLDVKTDTNKTIFDAFKAACDGKKRIVPSDIPRFDECLGGFERGGVTLLAAYPSAGKTALSVQVGWNIAKRGGNVLFFSIEESKTPLLWRVFANQTGIPITAFRNNLSESQSRQFMSKQNDFVDKKFNVIDSVSSSNEIRAICTAENAKHQLDLAIIDSASMVSTNKGENEIEKANRLGWEMTQLAKELQVPILLLAHVNNEGLKAKAGSLTSIYGGQGLVKPAAVIIELRRNNDLVLDKGVVIDGYISKNRYGESGKKMQFTFIGEQMRFM